VATRNELMVVAEVQREPSAGAQSEQSLLQLKYSRVARGCGQSEFGRKRMIIH